MVSRKSLVENKWLYTGMLLAAYAALLVAFLSISPGDFGKLYGAQKFVSNAGIIYYITFALVFAGSFWIGASFGAPAVAIAFGSLRGLLTPAKLQVLLLGCAVAVVVGYVSLFYEGRSIMKSLADATAAKQEAVLTGTGAPLFLMALTPLFAGLLGLSLFGQSSLRLLLYGLLVGAAVVVCVGIRFMYFERLPLFELGVPLAWFLFRRLKTRTVLILAVAGFIGFIGLFSVAEYFRSWKTYVANGLYENTPGNYAAFIFYRLAGYYMTPVNHLCMMAREHFDRTTEGYYTFRFILNSPLVGKALQDSVPICGDMVTRGSSVWVFLLDPQYGLNPEYNLFGFYGVMFLDWGYLGCLVAVPIGLVGGALLAGAKRGMTLGVLGFPIFLIGMAESPRLSYWTNERAFLSIVGVMVIATLMSNVALSKDDAV